MTDYQWRQQSVGIMVSRDFVEAYDDMVCQWQTLNPPRPARGLGYSGNDFLDLSPDDFMPRIPLERRFASFKRRLASVLQRKGVETFGLALFDTKRPVGGGINRASNAYWQNRRIGDVEYSSVLAGNALLSKLTAGELPA